MRADHAPELAARIAAALRSNAPESLAGDTAAWRATFDRLHFVREAGAPAR
jgi:glycine hydroxymethyltransferase